MGLAISALSLRCRSGLAEGPVDPPLRASGRASVKIGKPDKFTFHPTFSPAAVRLPDLVRVAGMRWTIAACFEEAKGEVGLDHYEVRSWTGWHRHITFAMLAHAHLTIARQAAAGGRRHRPARDGSAAVHRPRGTPPPLASDLGVPARSPSDRSLVDMAPTPPAACQTLPPAQTNQNP